MNLVEEYQKKLFLAAFFFFSLPFCGIDYDLFSEETAQDFSQLSNPTHLSSSQMI